MSQTRISRAKRPVNASMPHMYCAPGRGRILRVFDAATADGSLIEVPFARCDDEAIRLAREPASDVWVEHVDTTISPSPGAVFDLGGFAFLNGHLVEIRDNGVPKPSERLDPSSSDILRRYGIPQNTQTSTPKVDASESAACLKVEPDPRLDEIVSLLKQLVAQGKSGNAMRAMVFNEAKRSARASGPGPSRGRPNGPTSGHWIDNVRHTQLGWPGL